MGLLSQSYRISAGKWYTLSTRWGSKLLKEESRMKAIETNIDACRSYFRVYLFVLRTHYIHHRTQIWGQIFFGVSEMILTHESITNSKLIRWYNINAIPNRVFQPTEDLIGSLKIATPCVKLLWNLALLVGFLFHTLRSKSVFASKELYISGLNLLLQLTAYQAYTNISRPHACPKQLKWQYKLYYDSFRWIVLSICPSFPSFLLPTTPTLNDFYYDQTNSLLITHTSSRYMVLSENANKL